MTPSRSPRSVQRRVLLPLLATGLVVFTATGLLLRSAADRQIEEQMRLHAQLAVRAVNAAAESVQHEEEVRRIVNAIGAERHVNHLLIAAGDPPTIVAATHNRWIDAPLEGLGVPAIEDALAHVVSTNTETCRLVTEREAMICAMPMRLERSQSTWTEGAVLVEFDHRPARLAIARWTQRAAASFAAVIAIVLAVASFVLELRVLRPLAAIERAAERRAAGEPGPSALALADDEIGRLARTLARANADVDAALLQLGQTYRALDASALVLHTDGAGVIARVNERSCELYGLPAEVMLGRHFLEFVGHGPTRADLREGLRHVARGETWNGEIRFLRPGQETRWVNVSVVPSLDANGVFERFTVIGVDVTPRKRAEQALRASEARKAAILASVLDCILGLDAERRIEEWNPAAERAFGIPRAAALGLPLADVVQPGDDVALADFLHARSAEIVGRRLEVTALRRDGTAFPAELAVTADEASGRTQYTAYLRDLSAVKEAEQERLRLEVQLRSAQKLESIGQLAAGVAHEINTPMQFIGDNLGFLRDAFGDLVAARGDEKLDPQELAYLETEVPSAIQAASEGVARVARIVAALKEFSHPGRDERTPTDLNRAIENTLLVCRNEWKYDADVETDLDPALPPVRVVPGELNQVLLNLIVNASHAIRETRERDGRDKGRIRIATLRDGDWVELRVEDDGAGIPPEIRERVYDLFFTTKPVGRGTGQGLAIARRIVVEKHGGTMHFESEVGRGTVFVVRLPIEPVSRAT